MQEKIEKPPISDTAREFQKKLEETPEFILRYMAPMLGGTLYRAELMRRENERKANG